MKNGKFLVDLARKAILHYLEKHEVLEILPEDVPNKEMTEKRACFVTLMKRGELRGCIGSLEPVRPLVFDVIQNALNAAFEDPRFYPVIRDEIDDLEIEISVLTVPEKIQIKSKEELLEKLVPGKHGLIIEKGWNRATFLPSVWDQLPGKDEFLSRLCSKAGLGHDEWKKPEKMQFYFYEAEKIS
ncbi:AmmeMemoRadiSam system protein A [Candidatus Micrarchaeota archaeon]|nr:AmmeMemoRadiSam system protein A [Candidatus Micrarchaeota archaeon]